MASASVVPPSCRSLNHLKLHFLPSLSRKATSLFLRSTFRRSTSSVSVAMSYERELAVAKKAASLAARLCQSVQKTLLQSDVQSKSDKSPVTVADYELKRAAEVKVCGPTEEEIYSSVKLFFCSGSQALVSFVIGKELAPESFSLVAEEDSGDLRKEESLDTLKRITKLVNNTISSDGTYNISPLSTEDVLAAIDSGKSAGGPHGQHWVLDPIDGTKGFLRGDQYAIALALLSEGKVILGVLACPNLPMAPIGKPSQISSLDQSGCLFSARLGAGTDVQLLHDSSSSMKVNVSSVEDPAEASFFESFEAAHSLHDLSGSIAKKLGVKAPPVRIDSQAKYGALSRGDGAIYLRFPHKGYREKIWDHAAGCIVVTEAGGIVSDAAGRPLDFSKGKYLDLDTGIIVTNKTLMPALLNAVQEAIKESESSSSL